MATRDGLKFNTDSDGPIAVYIQIENIVQFAIASGELGPGDALPSVRDLSSQLDVNPNTVTKAYRDLELLGLVVTRRGIGVKVAEKARKLCQKRIEAMVRDHLRDAVGECRAAGIKAAQIRKIVSETIASEYAPYRSKDGR